MNLQGLIAEKVCPTEHTLKSYVASPRGEWNRGQENLFVLLVQGDGQCKYRLQCQSCGKRTSDLPTSIAASWGLFEKRYPFDIVDARQQNIYPACSVSGCADEGREFHHFAPRNTFGREAEAWPVLPLCRPHHLDWHQRMDGYRWHRQGAAA